MEEQPERPAPPPRSHSLKIAESRLATAAPPLAVAFDFQSDDNDEKKQSGTLVAQAKDALQRVEDGWSADELRPIVTQLVDRVQQLVCCCF